MCSFGRVRTGCIWLGLCVHGWNLVHRVELVLQSLDWVYKFVRWRAGLCLVEWVYMCICGELGSSCMHMIDAIVKRLGLGN